AQQYLEAKDYPAARTQLDLLLKADPFNPDLLAAKADTWARAGDDTALAQFYAAELQTMQQASLNATDKNDRIAGLRRGYIAALVRLKKPQEALDQYIEVINRFPEDQTVTSEAARFAQRNQLGDRLTAYYGKAEQASPKDYRWPMVLARIDTTLRRYPEAVSAYDLACHVRPDRTDLAIAEVGLQTRLGRFEDALKTNQRLYDLTYHNRDYLEAQAALLARLNRKDEAVKMLRAALIDGRPPDPANYYQAMSDLAAWHMYPEAQQTFEQGLAQLKIDSSETPGFDVYLRILTIERKQDLAIQAVSAAVEKGRIEKRNLPSAAWMTAIGAAMDEFFTAEEKEAEGKLLSSPGHVPRNVNIGALYENGQFTELYAQYLARHATMVRRLDQFQRSRLRFVPLGKQLEIAASTLPVTEKENVFRMALSAYETAGDTLDELRLIMAYPAIGSDPAQYGRLIANNPAQYAASIPHNNFGNGVVQYLIANTAEPQAIAALQARATSAVEPLWNPAYQALSGLYYSSSRAEVSQAFDSLLGPRLVGAEIIETADTRKTHLVGDDWFYYAARDGDYLAYQKLPSAAELLEAQIEAAPIASDRYLELGDTLRDTGQPVQARQEYNYAQELSPQRADVLDRLGALDWDGGNRAAALKDWQDAFDILKARIDAGPLSASFWPSARILFVHANRYGVINQVKPNADAMLHLYIKRSGAYEFEPFIEGILTEAKNRQAALNWLLDLSHDENGGEILQALAQSQLLTPAEQDPVWRATIARQERVVQAAAGDARADQQSQLNANLSQYAGYLGNQKRYQEALAIIDRIPDDQRPKEDEVRLQILDGRLSALIAHWQMKPDDMPNDQQLLAIAHSLRHLGRTQDADRLLDYDYSAQIQAGTATVSTYLGLAKLRFDQKRNSEGLDLVRDAVLSMDAPFANLQAAGRLLEDEGLRQEAHGYYAQWHTAEPWNGAATLAEARTGEDAKQMDAVRTSPENPYALRIEAARAMRAAKASVTGTTELDVLTHQQISPADASKPYFVAARVDAAAQAADWTSKAKLLAEAIAIDPRLTSERNRLADAAARSHQPYLAIAAYNPQPFDADLAQRIADAEIAIGESQQGQFVLQNIEQNTAASTQQRSHARQEREQLVSRLRLQSLNDSRAPEVTNGVAQDRIVKPKLKALPPDDVAQVKVDGGAQ
ncbi:MAG: hypothetical protein WA324_16940, partial [Bryobacteraceae bacterium]